MSSSGAKMPSHGPYPPTKAGLGGIPTKSLDIPIIAVFMVLFILGAVTHMTILQVNLRRGQKFIMSGMIFGFCMARIMALSLRLAWSIHPTNISLAIAAQLFVALGVILLFIINLVFAQRLIRASHPRLGWATAFSWAFKLYFASIIGVIIILITCSIQSFFTLDRHILGIDRRATLFGATYFAVAAFLPIPLIILRIAIPIRNGTEKFGQGRFRTKIAILVFASGILTLGAAFRAGIAYVPRPADSPAWYHSKACFYIFNFTIEWIVVALYAIIRVDKRFIVPNKAHGPGSYSGSGAQVDVASEPKPDLFRVLSEEEVFDGEPDPTGEKQDDLEAQQTPHTVANPSTH